MGFFSSVSKVVGLDALEKAVLEPIGDALARATQDTGKFFGKAGDFLSPDMPEPPELEMNADTGFDEDAARIAQQRRSLLTRRRGRSSLRIDRTRSPGLSLGAGTGFRTPE